MRSILWRTSGSGIPVSYCAYYIWNYLIYSNFDLFPVLGVFAPGARLEKGEISLSIDELIVSTEFLPKTDSQVLVLFLE